MSERATFDPTELTALVVDRNHYQRNITVNQLRMMGFGRVMSAFDGASAWQCTLDGSPDVILIEWFEEGAGGLEFVRRVRTNELSPNKAAQIFMLTTRGSKADVEVARRAGVDGYLRKPISVTSMESRVRTAVLRPKQFIVTDMYSGPCRRGPPNPDYGGPWRRLSDAIDMPAELVDPGPDEANVRAEVARLHAARLSEAASAFAPGDLAAARNIYKAGQALLAVAEENGDTVLAFGTREMLRYLDARGATDRLDPEIVRTHVGALQHLAQLPSNLSEQRERVANSLKRMVDKKIRQGRST